MPLIVLVLGSGPDAPRARAWPRTGIDRIVAINNAWRVRPDWDDLVHPKDFPPERRPPIVARGQRLHSFEAYIPAVNAHGGIVFCGGTMAFTAGYWALEALRPDVMAFLGCDMVYSGAGATHFYGAGTADPLRPDPTLQSLEAKSARLAHHAARQGCALVNLSEAPESRLAFPRRAADTLADWTADDTHHHCARLLTAPARALAARAARHEAALDYAVPSGRYWREFSRFDAAALSAIDALWLEADRLQAPGGAAGRVLAVT